MNSSRFIRFLFFFALVAELCSYVEGQENYQSLKFQVNQLAAKGDLGSINNMINAEEAQWITKPDVSYFEKVKAIGFGLMDGASTAQRYWLFRRVVWNALLKPAPPANESVDIERTDSCREDLIWASENLISYVAAANPEMYVAIRHDTALLLEEYARQIRSKIIANYHNKPVAPVNKPIDGLATRQNEVDNTIQHDVQVAFRGLSRRQHVNYLIQAYGHGPKDEQEAKEVLDALNIQGLERDKVIRSAGGPRSK